MSLIFKNPGYDQKELDELSKSGIGYDRKTKRQLLEAKNTPRHADKEKISFIEKEFSIEFPSDYVNFLLKNNGGVPSLDCFDISGGDASAIRYFYLIDCPYRAASLEVNVSGFKGKCPDELIPIAEDVGGNYILLAHSGGERGAVYFWDHDFQADEEEQSYYDNLTELARSIGDFLLKLRKSSE